MERLEEPVYGTGIKTTRFDTLIYTTCLQTGQYEIKLIIFTLFDLQFIMGIKKGSINLEMGETYKKAMI